MRLMIWAVLLAVLAQVAPCDEFTFEVNPAWSDGRTLEGATIKVSADPLWGRMNEDDLNKFKSMHGALPDVNINATVTTPKVNGRVVCQVKATVTTSGEGALPTDRLIQADGSELETRYVYAKVEASLDGYHTVSAVFAAYAGKLAYCTLPKTVGYTTIKGRAVHVNGQKPAANLKLVAIGDAYREDALHYRRRGTEIPLPRRLRCEFTTDADGNFSVTGPDVSHSPELFQTMSSDYAFALDSKAWYPSSSISSDHTMFDYGTLVVVPGGGIKFKLTDMDTGKPVMSGCQLRTTWNNRRYDLFSELAPDTLEAGGIPEGTYSAQISHGRARNYWFPITKDVVIQAGTVVDLGDQTAEPARTVQIIVSDESGNLLPKWQVTATYSGDTPRSRNLPELGRPIVISRDLKREDYGFGGLFTGPWKLFIRLEGYPAIETTIQVPAAEPIKLVAEAGGGIEVRLLGADGNMVRADDVFALRDTSPDFETFKAIDRDEYSRNRPMATNAIRGGIANDVYTFKDLAAGTYLLFAHSHNCGLMRAVVDVEKGKVLKVDLKPVPGRLNILVTEKGKPKAGVKLEIVDIHGSKGPSHSVTSNADGQVEFEVNKQVAYFVVLTKADYDAFKAKESDPTRWDLREYEARKCHLMFNKVVNMTVELFNSGKVDVKLRMKGPSGAVFSPPTLHPANNSRSYTSFTATLDGDDFVIVGLPVGSYRLVSSVRSKDGHGFGIERLIVVDDPPAQTIEIEVKAGKLSLTLTAEKGRSDPAGAEILLWRDVDWDGFIQPHRRRIEATYRADAKGKLEISLIEAGTWHVTARAYGKDPRLGRVVVDAANASVSISGSTKLSLKFSANVGSLAVGIPQTDQNSAHYCRVVLLNAKDELVHPGDPTSAYGSMWEQGSWWGKLEAILIPVGTYKVVFVGIGLLPVITENVKIEKGKTTELELKPLPGTGLSLTVKGLAGEVPESDIEWIAEDAAGKPLKLYGSGYPALRLGRQKDRIIEIGELTPEVKRVRVRIAGYEEIVIDTQLESGKGQRTDATAKPK
ncbi:MAG: hypothetical protein IT464_16585 [Planctomycetes bacterium]|nr:hypothetical protein [Planctomycetota bacterium]